MTRKLFPSNRIEATFLTEGDLFKALTGSAFEFLDRAIDEFSSSTKFSTIHFASAIELFLKARLMKEHWSLLLDKPDQADKMAFFKGDAKTVSPEQTVDRLRKIAQVTISQDCREIFSKIAKHRNKMIHFAHAGEHNSDSADGQSLIAAEQCAGWLALRTLLEGWPEFIAFKKDITRISKKMSGHRIFLQQIFDSKTAELEAHHQAGHRVGQCPSCQFNSMKVKAPTGAISEASCVVCYYKGAQIKVNCRDAGCGEAIYFSSYDGPPNECPKCCSKLSNEDIMECLDTGEANTSDSYLDYVPINCPYCSGYHSVVEHHKFYICTECFEIGESYGICGHCSEGQLGGVPEHSSLVGCEFCDGSNAWQKDD